VHKGAHVCGFSAKQTLQKPRKTTQAHEPANDTNTGTNPDRAPQPRGTTPHTDRTLVAACSEAACCTPRSSQRAVQIPLHSLSSTHLQHASSEAYLKQTPNGIQPNFTPTLGRHSTHVCWRSCAPVGDDAQLLAAVCRGGSASFPCFRSQATAESASQTQYAAATVCCNSNLCPTQEP
jgi:hypothetical protein